MSIERDITLAEKSLRGFHKVREAMEQTVAEIRGDPTIPEEGKAALIERAGLNAWPMVREVQEEATKHLTAAEKGIEKARRTRHVDGEALTEVRRLLDQGLSPGDILGRAAELGDARVTKAVAEVARYLHADDGKGQKRFADARGVDEAVEARLNEMGHPDEAARYSSRHRLLSKRLDKEVETTANTISSGWTRPQDRITLAYMENEEAR